jgi:predicted component of type VI protein secretion system
MVLRIEVLNYGSHNGEGSSSVVLEMNGGTIGRSEENHVVLPDQTKFISRRHAQISYENGRYFLTDTSKNGTMIVNKDLYLQGNKAELSDGDRLRIGDYYLQVSIIEPPRLEPEISVKGAPSVPASDSAGRDSIDDFFKESVVEAPPRPEFTPQTEKLDIFFPETMSSTSAEDDTESSKKAHDEDTGQQPLPNLQDAYRELFDIFLKSAGLEGAKFFGVEEIPDLMSTLGAVFREMVSGLWTVLQGRAEEKSEIRALMTGVLNIDNNPIKLSPRIEDGIRSLIKREHPAFLEPVEAVRRGFRDLMDHHVAMNAGIQAALMEVLDRFDPQYFAEKNKATFALKKKTACWDDYCESYTRFRNEALEDFFGKVFVQAYEEQIEKLRPRTKRAPIGNKKQEG